MSNPVTTPAHDLQILFTSQVSPELSVAPGCHRQCKVYTQISVCLHPHARLGV
jgi:hypothetical protein